jgi:oxalate decarboxylase/phosphoglucose isomerase-like protein (cupin superfamily)
LKNIAGCTRLILSDPETGERDEIVLDAADPLTVYVPAGVGHAFQNCGTETMMLVACADRQYDPADTVNLDLK